MSEYYIHLQRPEVEIEGLFKHLQTLPDLANILEIDVTTLHYYAEEKVKPLHTHYSTFELPKKSGGVRKIIAPHSNLKIIQQKLNRIFSIIYEQYRKPSVHGFTSERNIVTNAQAHSNSRYIFNIDLKDFFPTITMNRVKRVLMAWPYSLPFVVAECIAKLTCYKGHLPQGAPTSPIISNMICYKLDKQLQSLAKKHGCFYTRYADDITFSTNRFQFPLSIGTSYSVDTNNANVTEVGEELRKLIQANGFEINERKVRLLTVFTRQEVTGLVVNEFPNVKRQYINQIRAMLHAWDKFGLEKAENHYNTKYRKKNRNPYISTDLAFKDVVRGKIEFVRQVRGEHDRIYLKLYYEYCRLTDENFIMPSDLNDNLSNIPLTFISYAHSNSHIVNKIVNQLKMRGLRIWIDTDRIKGGARWSEPIDQGLRDATIVIVMMSPASMKSEHVKDEWQFFLAEHKPILPILIEKNTDVHFQLRNIQYVDFTDQKFSDGVQKIVAELKRFSLPRQT